MVDPKFVSVYSVVTGKKQTIPAHFMTNRRFATQFRLAPSQRAADEPTVLLPDETWTIPQLTQYAADHNINLAGAKLKDDVLTIVLDAATTPTSSTDTTPVPVETPATGEEE